jgi:hypothetical protein
MPGRSSSSSSRVTAPRLFSIFSRQGKREKTECIVLCVFVFCNFRALVVKFHTIVSCIIVSSYDYLHLTVSEGYALPILYYYYYFHYLLLKETNSNSKGNESGETFHLRIFAQNSKHFSSLLVKKELFIFATDFLSLLLTKRLFALATDFSAFAHFFLKFTHKK